MNNKRVIILLNGLTLAVALFGTISRIVLSARADMTITVLFYFTVQSNLMVCGLLTYSNLRRIPIFKKLKAPHPLLFGAVAMYIMATGVIYNVLLAASVESSGFNTLILNINHSVTPILYLLVWITDHNDFRYPLKSPLYWIIYPITYAVFASVEGAVTGKFRYFFLDFNNRPLSQYIFLMAVVIIFFIVLGYLLVLVNRKVTMFLSQSDPNR